MLEDLKKELISSAIQAEDAGLCKNKSGNFSALDSERKYMLITPSGAERKNLLPDDIPVLNRDGKIIENKSGMYPSSEWKMHLSAYETRSDFFAVAHTHSPFATAFAACGKKILPVAFEAYFYNWKTELVEVFLPGSEALANGIKKPLMLADVVLLKNHGVLTGGKNSNEACQKITYVEDVAQLYFYALQIKGSEPEIISEKQFQDYHNSCKEAHNEMDVRGN